MRRAVLTQRVHRCLILGGTILSLVWLAYFVGMAAVAPGELRDAAERAGLKLRVGSVRSLHPGELRVRDVELELPSVGALVSARELTLDPNWPSLFTAAPVVEGAQAPQLELRWASGSLGLLDARVRTPVVPSGEPGYGLIEIDGVGARWRTAAHAGTLTLRATLVLRHRQFEPGRPARVTLGDGVIDLSDVTLLEAPGSMALVAEGDGRLGMHAMLQLESATLDAERGFQTAGLVYLEGADASVGLALAGARESVRWMLSELEGQAFELEASLRACPAGLALDGVRFESGLTRASGALRAAAEGWSGALHVRRGSFSLGISVVPRGIETRLSPQPFWLGSELGRLPGVCVASGS